MSKARQASSNVLTIERFLEHGAEHGHDLDDWFEAERELRKPATSQVA